jgi:hypothetical protein
MVLPFATAALQNKDDHCPHEQGHADSQHKEQVPGEQFRVFFRFNFRFHISVVRHFKE